MNSPQAKRSSQYLKRRPTQRMSSFVSVRHDSSKSNFGGDSPSRRKLSRRKTPSDVHDGDFFQIQSRERNYNRKPIDVSKLRRQQLPFKPPARLKPAFDSPFRNSRGKGPELHKAFKFDLKEMFYEKGQSGDCYKSFSKWDLPFDRDQVMHELIVKRAIEESASDTKFSKASREYLWTRMTEAIFTEEPIQFYSTQMKKYYLPPEIKLNLTRKKEAEELRGVNARRLVKITESCEMVIPNTFEKEKWQSGSKKKEETRQTETKYVPPAVKIEQIKTSQKELTTEDKLDIKYGSMHETIDELKVKEREFDKYLRMILREKGIKRMDHLSPSGSRANAANQLSSTSFSRTLSPNASPKAPIKRRDSIKKHELSNANLSPMGKDKNKSGQFTISLTQEIKPVTETTEIFSKMPQFANLSLEEREMYEKRIEETQKAIQARLPRRNKALSQTLQPLGRNRFMKAKRIMSPLESQTEDKGRESRLDSTLESITDVSSVEQSDKRGQRSYAPTAKGAYNRENNDTTHTMRIEELAAEEPAQKTLQAHLTRGSSFGQLRGENETQEKPEASKEFTLNKNQKQKKRQSQGGLKTHRQQEQRDSRNVINISPDFRVEYQKDAGQITHPKTTRNSKDESSQKSQGTVKNLHLRNTLHGLPFTDRQAITSHVRSDTYSLADSGVNAPILASGKPRHVRNSTTSTSTCKPNQLKLYKPTAYLHSLKPVSTTRISNDNMRFSKQSKLENESPRGRTAYIAKREKQLIEHARNSYQRVKPRDYNQVEDALDLQNQHDMANSMAFAKTARTTVTNSSFEPVTNDFNQPLTGATMTKTDDSQDAVELVTIRPDVTATVDTVQRRMTNNANSVERNGQLIDIFNREARKANYRFQFAKDKSKIHSKKAKAIQSEQPSNNSLGSRTPNSHAAQLDIINSQASSKPTMPRSREEVRIEQSRAGKMGGAPSHGVLSSDNVQMRVSQDLDGQNWNSKMRKVQIDWGQKKKQL